MPTNFNIGGTDVDQIFVSRDYFITRYPELAGTFKASGLYVWGENSRGKIGDNTVISKSSPVQTIAGGSNWKQINNSSCEDVSACIKTNGQLWMWGYAGSGALGNNNSTINQSSPVQTIASGTNWKQISVGGYNISTVSSAAIKTDGTLWTWGANTLGALGDNTNANKSSPVQTVAGTTTWKFVASGGAHMGAIKTDGTLWMWGSNAPNGALGTNDIINRSSPVQTVAGGNNWKSVSANRLTTSAIKTDGRLWLWGRNNYGQLGNNSTINVSSPVQTIAGGTNWSQVSQGSTHTAAIKTDGTLWLWGSNVSGQLGTNTNSYQSSPVQTISGGTNWKQISCSAVTNEASNFSGAIKTNGSLWLWGNNGGGQFGDNTVIAKSSPVQTIAGGFNWIMAQTQVSGVIAIRDFSTDYIYQSAITPTTQTVAGVVGTAITSTTAYTPVYFSGTILYSISPNLPAGLALNSSTGVVSGTPTANSAYTVYTISAVGSLGGSATSIINIGIGASLWTWGRNNYGQLGNNLRTDRSSPIQTIGGGTTWSAISYGTDSASGLKNNGSLWNFGRNNYGQLGDNTRNNASSPIQTIAGGTNWISVEAGSSYAGGIKADGSLWTWGYGGFGQLGNNGFINVSSPIQTVAGGTNWSTLSMGPYLTNSITALKTDGTLWTWGDNNYGQLGNGSNIGTASPGQTVSGGTNWRFISQGSKHNSAIKSDGTLWLWGRNTKGELGTNNAINYSSPVQTVSSGTNWSQVAAGYNFTAAIKTDSTLWLWGQNNFGQLGTNGYGSTGISSPVQTISSGTNWTRVATGAFNTIAVKTDGSLWVWGIQGYGETGANTTSPLRQPSPVQTIAGGSTWKTVTAGYNSVAAIRQ